MTDENENSFNISLSLLPEAKEGNIYDVTFTRRNDLEIDKKQKISSLFERLKNRGVEK